MIDAIPYPHEDASETRRRKPQFTQDVYERRLLRLYDQKREARPTWRDTNFGDRLESCFFEMRIQYQHIRAAINGLHIRPHPRYNAEKKAYFFTPEESHVAKAR